MIEEKAYAKLNLSLEVINKRNDGYHNILSLMAAVKMHDLLKLRYFNNRIDGKVSVEIVSSGPEKAVIDSTPVEKNLIYRAAAEYLSESGSGADIIIEIDKHIPAGAGLGGGSADAAAMLRILNRKLRKFDLKTLESIASRVGADVPFCVSNGYSICEGIGDIIEPLSGNLQHQVLIVNNGIHSSTAESYEYIDLHKKDKIPENDKKILFRTLINQGMLDGRSISFINDFENAVFSRFSAVKELKKQVQNSGAFFTLMTGSGSTIFGLYDDEVLAEKAADHFSEMYKTVCLTGFLNRKTQI
ncbi:MAG: 4-(cytidine 5'-diphospho)-2-C-methyl-D-erythritol kinase [Spirochaetes bacterium]|nr:4-(cytidine 5'-diphospho)-2-C-methyl-D-erythritol kinase [Spirochaetota bacterium]